VRISCCWPSTAAAAAWSAEAMVGNDAGFWIWIWIWISDFGCVVVGREMLAGRQN